MDRTTPRVTHLQFTLSRCCESIGCLASRMRRDVCPLTHVAAVRAEPRSTSNRSEREPTSVRSTRYGSGHPIPVFPDTGRTFSWLQASLRLPTCAPGRPDCTAGVGDRGTLCEKQCGARLPQHCECLPDGEHDAMICPHATTLPLRRCIAAFARWSRA